MLLPIDQLSSGVRAVMPSPYRSPTTRPFHVTTQAAVMASAGSKARSRARRTFAVSSSGGGGAGGNTSPIGHGSVAASGSRLGTRSGLKLGDRPARGRGGKGQQ